MNVVKALCVAVVAVVAAACTPAGGDTIPEVVSMTAPLTVTAGNYLIDAHDGEIIEHDGQFIQYGTAYNCGFALHNHTTPWCGIRAYTSTDMVTWADRGLMFDPQPYQSRCSTDSFGCFRPHVLRRPDGSGKESWVMWVNEAQVDGTGYLIYTAPDPLGPWTEVAAPHLAVDLGGGFAYGDHDLTVDSSGVGWIVYTGIGDYTAGNTHDLVVERLDPTFTTGTGVYHRMGFDDAEAPSLFHRLGVWYLVYSDPMCGYCGGTKTTYQTAPSPLGPWAPRGSITETSCGGQPAAVNSLAGVFVYQSDRWQQIGDTYNPNQQFAETHVEVLQFDQTGGILPLQC